MKYKLHIQELLVYYYQVVENELKSSFNIKSGRKLIIVVKFKVMSRNKTEEACFCCFFYLFSDSNSLIDKPESEIKGLSCCRYSFVFDNFLYKLCLIGVKEKIGKERDKVCFHWGCR